MKLVIFSIITLTLLLTGCSGKVQPKEETKPVTVAETITKKDTDAYYQKLKADLDKLNSETQELQKAVDSLDKSLADIRKDYTSSKQDYISEIGILKASLQNALNDRATFESKFIQAQAEATRQQLLVTESHETYNELKLKLNDIYDREDETVNDYTSEERTAFYLIFDDWWGETFE